MSLIIFIILVNSLLNLKINGTIISYADDTAVILVKENNIYDFHKLVTSCLNVIKNWCSR